MVAAILAAIVGCGGSGDSSTPTIGKAAFIRQAKSVCTGTTEKVDSEGYEVLQEVEASSGKTGRAAEAVFIPEWLVPALETEVEELRALGTPPGDRARLDAIYKVLEEVTALAKSDPKRYLYEQANFKHPYHEAQRLSAAYGIPECGEP